MKVVVEDGEEPGPLNVAIEPAARSARLKTPTATPVATAEISDAPAVMSAGYVVGRFKRRWGVELILTAVLIVAVAGAVLTLSYMGNRRQAIPSIVVLPFVNESGDQDMEYLSDGISESLINSLSQLPQLKVIARSSAFRYKGKEANPQEVATALGVQALLVGHVAQRGGSLVVSAELIDARDKTQIWGERYERKVADLLSMQREIAREITDNLRPKLSGTEQSRVVKSYTENLDAYHLYLRGRFYWSKRTEESVRKSIEFFQHALEKDSHFTLAYVGVADSYLLLGVPGSLTGSLSTREAIAKAQEAAERALQIDDMLAQAHASLAHARFLGLDWAGADGEFTRSIELNPNYEMAHHWYALCLSNLGRHDEALREIRRALELDPLSLTTNANLGSILYFARRYDEAAEQCRKTIDLDETFAFAHYRLGMVYEQQGSSGKAIAELRKAAAYSNQHPSAVSGLAHALAVSGDRSGAQQVLRELMGHSDRLRVTPYEVAVVYVGLGENEQAFRWLDRAVDTANYINMPKVDPRLDPLRADPRFVELLRRLRLQPT